MLRRASDPLIVDLGYGATGITTLELAARLSPVRPDIDVLGLEIDPERVERAREQLRAVRAGLTTFDPDTRVSFARGGFEVPAPRRPTLIRALNVLRRSGLNVKRFAGASAGAWCAAFFMSGCSTSHWADTYRRTAELVGDTYPEA